MKQVRSHKIKIYPNKQQKQLLINGCSISRFVYNWGLANQALVEFTPVDNGTSGLSSSDNNLSSLVEAGIKVTKNNINQNIHFSMF